MLDWEETEVLSKDTVKVAAMKVSSISGDARRVLDICRYVHLSLTTPPSTYPTTLYNGYDVPRKANADGQWNSYNLPNA